MVNELKNIELTDFSIEKQKNKWGESTGAGSDYFLIINNLAQNRTEEKFFCYNSLLEPKTWEKLENGDFNAKKRLNVTYIRQKQRKGSFTSNRARNIEIIE